MKKKFFQFMAIFWLCCCGPAILTAQTNTGDIWLDPLSNTVEAGQSFVTSLYVNSGSQNIKTVNIRFTYDASVIQVDYSRGNNGVSPGAQISVNLNSAGTVTINGSYSSAKSAERRAYLLSIYWTAQTTGSAIFNPQLTSLLDDTGAAIGTPAAKKTYITVKSLPWQPILNVTPLGDGIAAQDDAAGKGFIMYSEESVFTRFSNNSPLSGNAEHFICVIYNGSQWKYDSNGGYYAFTPAANDTLVAEVDFSIDEVTSLEGVYATLGGIHYGYASGDLVFTADLWEGDANNGEFFVSGSHIILPVFTGNLSKGVLGTEDETGEAYIMYSRQAVRSRFTSNRPSTDNSEHFINVRYAGGSWQYDNNSGFFPFTPVDSDLLLARVDYTNDTVRSLRGKCFVVNGIRAGYAGGDIEFLVNFCNGTSNAGEFCVTGTYFIPPLDVSPLNWGIAAQENATGSGYILYSAENIFSRFAADPPYTNDAYHFIAVKYISDVWHYDNNSTYVPFTPRDTDILVAVVNYTNDTITSLEGSAGITAGITKGYGDGDLGYIADQWHGVSNNGEFSVTGNYFCPYLPYRFTPLAPPDSSNIKTVKSNSQVSMPKNLYLGDVDGDLNTDFIQVAGNRLLAFKTNPAKTGLLHGYLEQDIKKVYTGDFAGLGYDQLLVALNDGSYQCLWADLAQHEWFVKSSQTNLDSWSEQDVIVGDYDGDRRDELFIYIPATGAMTMYELNNQDMKFRLVPDFALGNLNSHIATNLKIRAGDFNGDSRTDLLLITSNGRIKKFSAVRSNGLTTFWWAFTTNLLVASGEEVSTARIDEDLSDDVIIHSPASGAVSFYKAVYENGNLPAITNVLQGQFPIIADSQIFWVWNKETRRENGYTRNDILVYNNSSRQFKASHARWSGTSYTYWWWYTNNSSNFHSGWPVNESHEWIALKGKIDGEGTLVSAEKFDNLFYGYESINKYYRDISYGGLLQSVYVDPQWYNLGITLQQYKDLSRGGKINSVINASGVDVSSYFKTIAVTNLAVDSGSAGGRVLTHQNNFTNTFIAHEIAHGYGFNHSYTDDMTYKNASWSAPGEYGDNWDIMSANAVYRFYTAEGIYSGPEMNTPYKTKKSWIPSNRIMELQAGNGSASQNINLAPVNRPEVSAFLMVKIVVNADRYYSIEYRQKTGWDRGIPGAAVLIHEVKKVDNKDRTYLIETAGDGGEWKPGETYQNGEGLSITINEFDDTENRAEITVNY